MGHKALCLTSAMLNSGFNITSYQKKFMHSRPFYSFLNLNSIFYRLAFIALPVSFICSNTFGQEIIEKTFDLTAQQEKAIEIFNNQKVLFFQSNVENPDHSAIQFYSDGFDLPKEKSATIQNFKVYFSKNNINVSYEGSGARNVNPTIQISKGRKNQRAIVNFLPGQWTTLSNFQLLDSIKITFRIETNLTVRTNPPNYAPESILRSVPTYKIATTEPGIYRVDNEMLASLGINTANIDPSKIRMFGTLPGPLPELNSISRTDDLQEIAIQVNGGDDGKWDIGDQILFYSPGAHKWFKQSDSSMTRITNIYDDKKYFYIQVNDLAGKRLANKDNSSSFDLETDKYDHVERYEVDKTNLLRDFSKVGGGQIWLDELISNVNRTKDFTNIFNINNLVANDTGSVYMGFAARSKIPSTVILKSDGQSTIMNLAGTTIESSESRVAFYALKKLLFKQNGGKWTGSFEFPQVSVESMGWLDFMEVNVKRNLVKEDEAMDFRLLKPGITGNIKYNLSNLKGDEQIWEITNMFQASRMNLNISNGQASIISPYYNSNQFICFAQSDIKSVEKVGLVPNQNIHGLETPDMVIVYHSKFVEEAKQYASYRSKQSGIMVHALDVEQIKNEFSGGAQDPTGIRDLARMFYSRNPDKFKYILMFGDGSYDYKNIIFKEGSNKENSNYVPVYEYPRNLFHPIYVIPSDDYFGFMDEDEGEIEYGLIDVYVGRFPVQDRSQAQTILNKIKIYETDKAAYGDWRHNLQLISDDWDDKNTDNFINQTESLFTKVRRANPEVNILKVNLDIYKQEATVGGESYPAAVTDMNDQFNSGVLVSNYIGHGGVDGLAQEKIIDRTTLNGMKNKNRFPMLITGTCSFSTYDDPEITSVGKVCINKPNGGMIALMTTTRSVYISGNEIFINKLFQILYSKVNGIHLTNGEILATAKNNSSGSDRLAFVLLGDPSMTLSFPKENIVLESINGKPYSIISNDTIKALEKVILAGSVRNNQDAVISDFNGTMTLTVFDKEYKLYSNGNDGYGANIPVIFQKNVIFKGKASVINGQFSIEFISPKDINYAIDTGKLSFYAENGLYDAGGYNTKIKIGGESSNPIVDNTPPEISLYLNDLSFKSGATVNTSPVLIAKLTDDTGINISSSSIGHEIVSTLNNDPSKDKIMNDFYSAEKDNYKNGEVQYQFDQLEAGNYTLKLRAWDLNNNKSESEIEFIVSNSEQNTISNLLNYPNPFTTATSFMFEFDSQNSSVEAQIAIYSVSGKLIKTISEPLSPTGKRFKTSTWNGLDDYGDQLAKGVYIYKVKVINTLDNDKKVIQSDFQKLVLLK